MNDEQPTQQLTDAGLARIREHLASDNVALHDAWLADHALHLLAEVDRLRAENHAQVQKLEERTTQWRALLNLRERDAVDYRELKSRMDKLRTEATGTALGHLAKIERLQSQRDALVRKLGLDWRPDEFGDLDAVPMAGSADRSEMLSDLHWYISDMGLEHWQHCDVGDEDCYLCAGHVAIRDRWKGVE